jgi:PPOX class probable F420-dependent enzyme
MPSSSCTPQLAGGSRIPFKPMSSLNDPEVKALFEASNYAVISTKNPDGSILSTVVWISLEDGVLAVNSAEGRQWPANLDREGTVTVLVYPSANPYEFATVRGTASRATDGDDDAHIDRLAKKYINQDTYPFRQPGEARVKYVIAPDHVRYTKQ